MSNPLDDAINGDPLRQKLNLETAQLDWPALAPHFARGVVVVAHHELDLIEVAASIAEDDTARVAAWLESRHLHRATSDDARTWETAGVLLWAVVVKPWVVVQAAPPE